MARAGSQQGDRVLDYMTRTHRIAHLLGDHSIQHSVPWWSHYGISCVGKMSNPKGCRFALIAKGNRNATHTRDTTGYGTFVRRSVTPKGQQCPRPLLKRPLLMLVGFGHSVSVWQLRNFTTFGLPPLKTHIHPVRTVTPFTNKKQMVGHPFYLPHKCRDAW